VIDKLPNLNICLSHAGGYLPFAAGRFDHAFGRREDVSGGAGKLPSDYLKAFYYDCISHSDDGLKFVVEQVGVDRVLVGTDFPADMGLEKPHEFLVRQKYLSDADRNKIESENALKLGIGTRFGKN
jgi:aminocarboxymuconate-semialdehyde decarboxylase